MKEKWILRNYDHDEIESISSLAEVDKRIAALIRSRGYSTPGEIRKYLTAGLSSTHSPFLIDSMHEAVSRIRAAIHKGEKIGIFSDSDLDGLTSLALLDRLLKKCHLTVYHRYPVNGETYGLTEDIIDDFISEKVELLITVDSGIRDIKEIEYAVTNNIDVIVTDHHEQDEKLPDAIVINPKKNSCKYPFKDLAGVGVVFKLCHGLLLSYLPGYNRTFFLAVEEGHRIEASVIENGIVREIREFTGKERYRALIDAARGLEEEAYLVYHGEKLNEAFAGERTFRDLCSLRDLGNSIPEKRMNELIKRIENTDEVAERKIERANSVFHEIQYYSSHKIRDFIDSVIELVAIGLIADVMPLVDENRVLARKGISELAKRRHRGLSRIMKSGRINSRTVGWEVAPFLNTPGRYGKTGLTAEFFLSDDHERVDEIVDEIDSLNRERKDKVKELYELISEKIDRGRVTFSDNIIFEMRDDIPPGLSGLLAVKIAQRENRPVIIASSSAGEGMIKGSGRSLGDFNFLEHVEPFSSLFMKFGGHTQAFGFTASQDLIRTIINKINDSVGNDRVQEEKLLVDLELDLSKIDLGFIESLSLLEPYGKGNEEPLFYSGNLTISEFRKIGKEGTHGRYTFAENSSLTALGWNIAAEMEGLYNTGKKADIVYRLEINNYNGRSYPQLILEDIDAAETLNSIS